MNLNPLSLYDWVLCLLYVWVALAVTLVALKWLVLLLVEIQAQRRAIRITGQPFSLRQVFKNLYQAEK